jgi:Serine hydrolase (FSH1)
MEHPPPHPPLFRAAIFFSAPLPFSHSPNYGIDTRRYFGINVSRLVRSGSRPDTVPPHLIPDAAYLRRESDDHTSSHQATTITTIPTSPIYQMFHPSTDPVRIAIPTAHIYGRKGGDAWRAHAMDLVTLCSKEGRMVLSHDGGHEVPRGPGVNEEVCDVFEAVVAVAKAGGGAGVRCGG